MIRISKSMFFDRAAVMSKVDAATRKVLSKFGAFVRTAAKSSIRPRKRISRPGEPPSSHSGLLKKFIWFGFDASARSVVIGPVPLNQVVFDGDIQAVSGRVPEVLEYGGSTVLRSRRDPLRDARYAARPYMNPAFEQERPKLPAMWAGSIK